MLVPMGRVGEIKRERARVPQTSAIEWTEATWNPVTGCSQVSPGCAHCYAKTFAERWRNTPGHPYEQGFDLRLWPERLEVPLRWRRPRAIFVNSMSDLFHEDIPLDFIHQVFATMRAADWHTFQILTKRADRMAELADQLDWAPNVWMGVSVENRRFVSSAPNRSSGPWMTWNCTRSIGSSRAGNRAHAIAGSTLRGSATYVTDVPMTASRSSLSSGAERDRSLGGANWTACIGTSCQNRARWPN
jgi:DNA repair photolyase